MFESAAGVLKYKKRKIDINKKYEIFIKYLLIFHFGDSNVINRQSRMLYGKFSEKLDLSKVSKDIAEKREEIDRLKNALSKSNSEAADYKRQLKEKMSAEELKAKEDAEKMEQLIPDAGLVTVAGAGHFSFLENTPLFLRVVESFLGKEMKR